MTFPTEALQLLALKMGRWKLGKRLGLAIYDLTGWLLSQRLSSLGVVESVLLRGSRVSGRLVPGLSDLDFEVILNRAGEADVVDAVLAIHRAVRPFRLVFPWLESPYIRSASEWEQARHGAHECLSHSRWKTLTGPMVIRSRPASGRFPEALAQFRICLRELTKTIPTSLFRTPRDGVLSSARCNPDRLEALRNLSGLLEVAPPESKRWLELQNRLERQNYLTRSARSDQALHLAHQYQAMEALAERFLEFDQERADDRFTLRVPSKPQPVRDDGTLEAFKRAATLAGFEVLESSGGCRYSQNKLYLLPPSGTEPEQLAEALSPLVEAWGEPGVRLDRLSYGAPIVLPRVLLSLVHLGFGSCLEGFLLRQHGVLTEPVAFARAAFEREMLDGVYLLRKKVGLLPRQRDRFVRYLQDHFVGVYPGLAMALRHGEVCTQPEEAALRFCQSGDGGDYARRLSGYLGENLEVLSRRAVDRDPEGHLLLLENFHRRLVSESARWAL